MTGKKEMRNVSFAIIREASKSVDQALANYNSAESAFGMKTAETMALISIAQSLTGISIMMRERIDSEDEQKETE